MSNIYLFFPSGKLCIHCAYIFLYFPLTICLIVLSFTTNSRYRSTVRRLKPMATTIAIAAFDPKSWAACDLNLDIMLCLIPIPPGKLRCNACAYKAHWIFHPHGTLYLPGGNGMVAKQLTLASSPYCYSW